VAHELPESRTLSGPQAHRAMKGLFGTNAAAAPMGKLCTCGHGKRAHEHYRAGSDCALCTCVKFHRPPPAWLRSGHLGRR
jgi:hypothetical protein